MNKEVLRKIGLTNSEIKVYIDIIKHEDSLASEISNRVKISRTYIYDSIRNLIDKGLISYVFKNNRKYFKALKLEKLLEYFNDQILSMKNEKQEIKKLILELKPTQKPPQKKPLVEIFEGKEGLKTILNDIIKTKKDAVGWGHTTKVKRHLPDWFLKRYLKERDKKGIKVRQLYAKGGDILKSQRSKFKELPEEFSSPVTFGAYGDNTIIFFWSETPIIIKIKSIGKIFEL